MSAEVVSHARTVTIYALTDPDSGEVRYVGQTINAPFRLRASFVVLWHEIIRSPIGALMSRLIFMVLGRLVALIGRK